MTAVGEGRVTGRAIVDLDAVRNQKKRSWTDPLGYLSGMLPLTASGVLTTQNGVGRFQLETAEISGVPIPKPLLQELVGYYSRTPENPAGINMDDTVRAARAHPRDPRRAGRCDNRAIEQCPMLNVQC